MPAHTQPSFWGTVKSAPKGVAIAGLVFLAIGTGTLEFLEHLYPSILTKLIGIFVTEIGFACLIAFGLAVTIEIYARREYSKGIIAYLYAIDLDSRVFLHIEKYIVRCPYYRKNMIVSYTFIGEKDGAFLLDCKVSYTIINVSRSTQEYCVGGSLEISPLNSQPHEWPETLGLASMTIDGRLIPHEEVQCTEGADSERCQEYKALKATRLKPQEKATIEIRHYVEKLQHDSEVWQAAIPSSGVELRLDGLSKYNLAVGTEAIHPEGQNMEKLLSKGGLVLKLKEPLMVRNGIHFWWSPKAPKALAGAVKPPRATPAPKTPANSQQEKAER